MIALNSLYFVGDGGGHQRGVLGPHDPCLLREHRGEQGGTGPQRADQHGQLRPFRKMVFSIIWLFSLTYILFSLRNLRSEERIITLL